MAQLHTLPFAGSNEVYSLFGWRDLSGNGKFDNKHGGWDIRPPKVGGVVPTATGQACCAGAVDWKQVYNAVTTRNDSTSYGNAVRIKTTEGVYCYMAHLYNHALAKGQQVQRGAAVGQYGPKTTGNSGGVHCHLEYRVGGTGTGQRVCPGEVLGISNTKDVVYDREAMEAHVVGYLRCTKDAYRWRLGAGTDKALYKDANNGAGAYCHAGVIYRVYATAIAGGVVWCQITPPQSCITRGTAPACWVSSQCGVYEAKAVPVPAPAKMQRCTVTPATVDGYVEMARVFASLKLPMQCVVSDGDAESIAAAAHAAQAGYTSEEA